MSKASADRWVTPDGLERVTNWAAKGCTTKEIARNMGIGKTTLYRWAASHPEIRSAIDEGRTLSVECVENALFRLAVGAVTEEVTVTEERPDGSTMTRTTITRKAPNVTAAIFYLKNRAGYSDNPHAGPYESQPVIVFDPSVWETARRDGREA